MADGKGQSKTTQKPAHCECPGLTGNAWKCGKNLKWIKKSSLSGDFLLYDIFKFHFLKEYIIGSISFIMMFILLVIFTSHKMNYILKFLNFFVQKYVYIIFPLFIAGLLIVFLLSLLPSKFFKPRIKHLFSILVIYTLFSLFAWLFEFHGNLLLMNKDATLVLTSITIAIITLMIPIGIATLSNLYGNGNNKNEDFMSLDFQVFLKYLLNPYVFVLYIAATFVPLLFFANHSSCSSPNLNYTAIEFLLISIIGIIFLTSKLIELYTWYFKDKFRYRKRYLDYAGFDKEFIEAWKSVWIAKDIDEKEEKEYLCIFVRRVIESLSCKEKLDITKKLLEDFKENLSNRNFENMRFIHDILIEIAEEIKISKFKDKTVYTIPSIKNTPNIINEILNHINNYEWKNSNKTCYNAVCYIYLYNLFNYPVYYSFHRK